MRPRPPCSIELLLPATAAANRLAPGRVPRIKELRRCADLFTYSPYCCWWRPASFVAACGEDEETPSRAAALPPRRPPRPPRRSRWASSRTSAASTTARSTSSPTRASSARSPSSASRARVLISKANSDYVPNLSTLAQQKYDLVIGVGFLMAEAMNTVAAQFPDTKFADHRRRRDDGLEGQAEERPRRCCSRSRRRATSSATWPGSTSRTTAAAPRLGRRPEDPAGRPLHRRLPGGREGGQPGRQGRQRLLAEVRRPGPVQGAGAQPDRGGREGRLPGRRRLRPRRARRREGEGRAGHRRGRRPGLPGRPHHDLGAQEGRRRGVRRRSRRPRTARSRAARTRSSTSSRAASGIGETNEAGAKYAAQVKEVQDKIASGELTDIPDAK